MMLPRPALVSPTRTRDRDRRVSDRAAPRPVPARRLRRGRALSFGLSV
jgi:hypothetical protein